MKAIHRAMDVIREWSTHCMAAFDRGRMQLMQRRILDRQIGQITLLRDRKLGALAHAFLQSQDGQDPEGPLYGLTEEIRKLESEKELLVQEPTSLTQLIVPDDYASDRNVLTDFELIDEAEQQERYRKRLRGLYLDLGEVLLTDAIGRPFTAERESVEKVQLKLRDIRESRAHLQAQLPTERRLIFWLKRLAWTSVGLLLVWILF